MKAPSRIVDPPGTIRTPAASQAASPAACPCHRTATCRDRRRRRPRRQIESRGGCPASPTRSRASRTPNPHPARRLATRPSESARLQLEERVARRGLCRRRCQRRTGVRWCPRSDMEPYTRAPATIGRPKARSTARSSLRGRPRRDHRQAIALLAQSHRRHGKTSPGRARFDEVDLHEWP